MQEVSPAYKFTLSTLVTTKGIQKSSCKWSQSRLKDHPTERDREQLNWKTIEWIANSWARKHNKDQQKQLQEERVDVDDCRQTTMFNVALYCHYCWFVGLWVCACVYVCYVVFTSDLNIVRSCSIISFHCQSVWNILRAVFVALTKFGARENFKIPCVCMCLYIYLQFYILH